MMQTARFFPIGDSALTVEFGSVVSPELNRRAIALSRLLEDDPFPGFVESVPAYASVSIYYDIHRLRKAFPAGVSAFENVKTLAAKLIERLPEGPVYEERTVEIPVRFGGDVGPDLDHVAEAHSV